MRKYLLLPVVLVICAVFSVASFAADNFDKDAFAKNVGETFKKRGQDVDVKVDILKKMDSPAGYFFLKLTFIDKMTGKAAGEQNMFSDGKFIVQDFLEAKTMDSLGKSLAFAYTPKVYIDLTKLSPVLGKPGAKNVIVEVTDFQCPFCVQANDYLHKKLKNRNDVVLYIMHLPLRQIHPRAEILAKVFEAGLLMNQNFLNDLYDKANGDLTEVEIIDKYAKKTTNPEEFKEHIASKAVADKVQASEEQSLALNVRATPAMFINGKLISGLDMPLIDKAIGDFK